MEWDAGHRGYGRAVGIQAQAGLSDIGDVDGDDVKRQSTAVQMDSIRPIADFHVFEELELRIAMAGDDAQSALVGFDTGGHVGGAEGQVPAAGPFQHDELLVIFREIQFQQRPVVGLEPRFGRRAGARPAPAAIAPVGPRR